MQVVSLTAILKTESNGVRTWVGWAELGSDVPEGLVTSTLWALDLEDGSDARWLLVAPDAVTHFKTDELAALHDGECKRMALAKLSDAELEALKLSREG